MEAIMKEVALKEGFSKKALIENINAGLEAGAQFHGLISRAKISEGGRQLAVVVKTAPREHAARAVVSAKSKFRNEIHFYTRIYPELCRHGNPPTVPRLVWSKTTEGEEALVLEDLTPQGYRPASLLLGLEPEAESAVVEALGRLHATSACLREKESALFAELAGVLEEAMCDGCYFRGVSNKCNENLKRVSDEYLGPKYSEMLGKHDMTLQLVDLVKEDELVFTHGDPWASNILINYSESGELVDVALVDWQMCRLGQAHMDLAYLILSSCPGRPCPAGASRFGLWMTAVLLPFALGQADPRLVSTPEQITFPAHREADLRLAGAILAAANAHVI